MLVTCVKCGQQFAIPGDRGADLQASGDKLYCPGGHVIRLLPPDAPPGKHAPLAAAHRKALQDARREIVALKNRVAELSYRLEQAEAQTESGSHKLPE